MKQRLCIALALLLTLFIGLQDARAGTGICVVRKGDTMSGLFGAAYRKVAAENGLKNPDMIRVGQRLRLPKGVEARSASTVVRKNDGFITKTVSGDLHWKPGVDKLMRFPKKGPAAMQFVMPGLGKAEAAILWAQLSGSPSNGRFEKNTDGSLVAVLADSAKTRLDLSSSTMVGGRKAIRYSGSLKLADALKVKELTAMRVGDTWVVHPKICGNLLPIPGKPPVRPPITEPPTTPPSDQPPISVFPSKEGCAIEYELITGAGVWKNDAAQGHFFFGEGMLYSCDLGNGVSVGAGFYGYGGSGESGTGYSWDEGGFGPQVGVKRNFLKTHLDEFGQEVEYPAGWQLKARWLPNDYVEGGSDSYHVRQWGQKFGLYGEYWQRVNESEIRGVTGEYWWYSPKRLLSSWSGDSPQDRGSASISLYEQYRLSDDWQIRGIARGLHQNWDHVTFLQIIPELRYKETLMIDPWVSIPIINGNGAGQTFGISARVEIWGKLREKYERDGRNSVKYLGTVSEVSGSKPDATIGTKVTEQASSNVGDSLHVVPDSVGTEAVSIFAE